MIPWPCAIALSALLCAAAADPDTDGDGLSDFRETNKHRTDPAHADTDGDGIADGDWRERSEQAYTVRTVVQVMDPVSETALIDDYQDARVLERGDGWVTLEVVHYPRNTVAEAIVEDPAWRDGAAAMREHLAPGPTTDWDEPMRRDLLAALAADGIDVSALSDRETVVQVSRWLLDRVSYLNSSAYGIRFSGGAPELLPGTEDGFRAIMWKPWGTIEDQFQHELYGRGMYYNRTTGSCTSAANYLTTCLRAMGVPTRMVRAIPLADASDPAQVELVRAGIGDPEIRAIIVTALERLGSSFAAHTYNEVWVGGRWRRLNYTTLGQNILDEGMGLLTHVQVYGDLAEAGLGDTWGAWNASTERSEPFLGSNPYRLLEVSDRP